MLKVINVVGARPNFMKVAPIVDARKVAALDSPRAANLPCVPPLWDGHTADRILEALAAADH